MPIYRVAAQLKGRLLVILSSTVHINNNMHDRGTAAVAPTFSEFKAKVLHPTYNRLFRNIANKESPIHSSQMGLQIIMYNIYRMEIY